MSKGEATTLYLCLAYAFACRGHFVAPGVAHAPPAHWEGNGTGKGSGSG